MKTHICLSDLNSDLGDCDVTGQIPLGMTALTSMSTLYPLICIGLLWLLIP